MKRARTPFIRTRAPFALLVAGSKANPSTIIQSRGQNPLSQSIVASFASQAAMTSLDAVSLPRVSFIVPCHNSSQTIVETLGSVQTQTYAGDVEVSVYDDFSTDDTVAKVRAIQEDWAKASHNDSQLLAGKRSIVLTTSADVGVSCAYGPGFARNRAAEASTGLYLCWLDSDDLCHPKRVELQLARCRASPRPDSTLVGGGFVRTPEDATPVYTSWANSLPDDHAVLSYSAWRECALIQPTWFMPRAWFFTLGAYDEASLPMDESGTNTGLPCLQPVSGALPRHQPIVTAQPVRVQTAHDGQEQQQQQQQPQQVRPFIPYPEDPILLHRHLAAGGLLARVPAQEGPILTYRYREGGQTWSVSRDILLATKAAIFEERMLHGPESDAYPFKKGFSIWGCGRDGKSFYKYLSPAGRALVRAFLEVHPSKVGCLYPLPNSKDQLANEAAIQQAGLEKYMESGKSESKRAKRRRLAKEGRSGKEGASGGAGAGTAQTEAGEEEEEQEPPPPLPGPRPILPFLQGQSPILLLVCADKAGAGVLENVELLRRALEGSQEGAQAGAQRPLQLGKDLLMMV